MARCKACGAPIVWITLKSGKMHPSSRKHESKKHILPLSRGAGYTRRKTMENNTTMKDVILDKKTERYEFEKENFLASGELTVTITLGEYRQLLKDVATADARIREADKDRWDRNTENDKLKEEVNALKSELYDLKTKMVAEKDEEAPEEDEDESSQVY